MEEGGPCSVIALCPSGSLGPAPGRFRVGLTPCVLAMGRKGSGLPFPRAEPWMGRLAGDSDLLNTSKPGKRTSVWKRRQSFEIYHLQWVAGVRTEIGLPIVLTSS